MGWFNKKEEKKGPEPKNASLPELPKLPDLPELPDMHAQKPKPKEPLHKLPSFPNNSFGQKFSQNTIKEAVKGEDKQHAPNPEEKHGDGFFRANDFAKNKSPRMMQKKPLPKPKPQEFNFPRAEEIDEADFGIEDFETQPATQEFRDFETTEPKEEFRPTTQFERDFKKEPVFIRIDKFEDALKTFEKTKKEVMEIEKVLKDINDVRNDEDKELASWQNNLVKIKEQIEKVDADIFSKIE